MKRLAIILPFVIACIGVSADLASAAAPLLAATTISPSRKRPAAKRGVVNKYESRKASLRTISANHRRRYRHYHYRRARYHGPVRPSKERISEIQSALSRGGYYRGEPNGEWDASTINAMRNFQEDHGLDGTGKIDALSLQKLGLGSEIAGVDAPHPPTPPQNALPAGQSAPTSVPDPKAKPQTTQPPQTPKAPGTASGDPSAPSTSSSPSTSKAAASQHSSAGTD
jgi:peptidoglycan hydrolase-like protein with peptidoglycan-binding domain